MNTLIIGDKSKFAIEFCAKRGVQHIFENVRLWFENQYFGYLCSDVLLGVTSAQLDSISSRIDYLGNEHIRGESEVEIYKNLVDSDSILYDKYIFSLGENFDDFIARYFVSDNSISFLWKLSEFPNYTYESYPQNLLSASVRKDYFKVVVKDYTIALSTIEKSI